ncbi:hypothetical protein KR032_001898 [Drosophila birchii]|nr:hypothetical protein KR032_001898 [Drosophila birchii]
MGVLCEHVHLVPQVQRCEFVGTNEDCVSNTVLVNYLKWHYCNVDERNKFNAFWSVLAMSFVVAYVFWMMQFTILNYFCPCLKVIADSLRLSQSTAGVTLLTMANGSPDLFMSFASRLTTTKLSFVAVMSQALFLNMFVGGLLMIIKPFVVGPSNYLRDFGFLFLNVVYMDFMFKRPQGISWYMAVPSNLIIIIYLVVVVIDQNMVTARIRKLERKRASLGVTEGSKELDELKDVLPIKRQEIDRTQRYGGRNRRLFQQFWFSIYKFNKKNFRRSTLMLKITILLQMPIEMLLRLLIPMVDVEKPLYNWSKLLICLQLVAVPTYFCFILFKGESYAGFPYYSIVAMIMAIPSFIIFLVTRTDTPPRFFKLITIFSFAGIVMLIFGLLSEVNSMFFALATVLHLSPQFATATVICWAICSNDLVTHVLLASQGFSSMAYTATFSTPVLSKYQPGIVCLSLKQASTICFLAGSFIFLAMPLTHETLEVAPNNYFVSGKNRFIFLCVICSIEFFSQLTEGELGETVVIYTEIGILINLLGTLTTNFQMRRSFGFFKVTYYLCYLVVIILVEFDVIAGFGKD